MKYAALEEKEVMRKLLRGILSQAAKDIVKSKIHQEKMDATYFIKSEYCELMCYVAGKEYSMLLGIVNNKHRRHTEERKTLK